MDKPSSSSMSKPPGKRIRPLGISLYYNTATTIINISYSLTSLLHRIQFNSKFRDCSSSSYIAMIITSIRLIISYISYNITRAIPTTHIQVLNDSHREYICYPILYPSYSIEPLLDLTLNMWKIPIYRNLGRN